MFVELTSFQVNVAVSFLENQRIGPCKPENPNLTAFNQSYSISKKGSNQIKETFFKYFSSILEPRSPYMNDLEDVLVTLCLLLKLVRAHC